MTFPVKLEDRPLSSSSLNAFAKSPSHYVQYIQSKRRQSDEMLLGSAVDSLILTPDEFDKNFVVMPKFNKATKIGKAGYADFSVKNAGRTFLPLELFDKANMMRDSVMKNEATVELLSKITQTQKKIQFTDKKTGFPLTGFIDAVCDTYIFDLKTTQDAHPDAFSKSVWNYGYHVQAAIYVEAMLMIGKPVHFYFLTVEKTAPYGCAVIKASQDVIKFGKQEVRRLLDGFKYCAENDLWKSSYDFWRVLGKHELSLPFYLKQKLDK